MRLNNTTRKAIITEALKAVIAPKLAELQKYRQSLALDLYDQALPEVPCTDIEWVAYGGSVTIRHKAFEGLRWRNKEHMGTLEYEVVMLLDEGLSMGEQKPIPRRWRYGGIDSEVVPQGRILQRVEKFVEEAKALRVQFEELETDLANLLNSVRTFPQLRKAWPEGKALYEKHAPKPRTTAVVDAGLVKKVTADLTPLLQP